MIIIRKVELKDLNALYEFSIQAGVGITTLPADKNLLEKKILKSIASFENKISNPEDEHYLFVAEDINTNTLIGSAGIFAQTGGKHPLYFYKKIHTSTISPFDKATISQELLIPISYAHSSSEICSLFVLPQARKSGIGKLLSLSRFLFIANHRHHFTGTIFAELRGYLDENGHSPFWEGIGKHFFNISFYEALEHLKYGKTFISHFLPEHPIYVSLLPSHVQEAIGKTHVHTTYAKEMLLQQGFTISDEIDVLDGGPKLKAHTDSILAIQQSKLYMVSKIIQECSGPFSLISNTHIDFRSTFTAIHVLDSSTVAIDYKTAEHLQISVGSMVRIYNESDPHIHN